LNKQKGKREARDMRPSKDYSEAEELYRIGVPIAEIARRQKPPVSRQTMWNALKRRGKIEGPVGKVIRELPGPEEYVPDWPDDRDLHE
jgi:hypothetical protein